jgi:hypothetical protein
MLNLHVFRIVWTGRPFHMIIAPTEEQSHNKENV